MDNAAHRTQPLSDIAPRTSDTETPASSNARWSGGMSYGTPELEQLHQSLLKEMEKAANCVDEKFADMFPQFIACVEATFRREEEWMDDIDFPMLKQHQEQHARLLAALHNLQCHVSAGNFGVGRDAITNLLPQWLTFHMSTMDTALSVAMQIAQAETEEAERWMQKYAALSWPF